jgi:hypothetical protein
MGADDRRIVLGTAVGYDYDTISVFLKSLRASGYSGDVVMLVGPLQFRFQAILRKLNVKPIPAWCIRRVHGPIFTYRFEIFARYLRAHAQRYTQVLISDVRDVLFQRHPFEGIGDGRCHFFLESSDWTIGREPTNLRWVQMFLAPDDVAKLRDRPISCCGVTLGGTDAMTTYLGRLADQLRAVPLKMRRKHGADTAFHNLIVHLSSGIDRVIVENNRHVATMGIESPLTYKLDADGRIRTSSSHLPAILHQYDRLPEFRTALESQFLCKKCQHDDRLGQCHRRVVF